MSSASARTIAPTATKMNPTDSTWLPVLLHFSDSALPVGAYAHSLGLEGLCQTGAIHDEASLRKFFHRDVLHALVSVDLPLIARAHRAALDGDGSAVRHWDSTSLALRPTRQLREAASKIGRQQWLLYEKTWQSEDSLADRSWFASFQAPVVLGVIFAERGVPVEGSLWAGAYQTYSALVQASLKLLPIGPGAGQKLLHETLEAIAPEFPDILAAPDDRLGTFNPLWDIAASRHERAAARMFIS